MNDTFLVKFEQRHHMPAFEACRMLGLPYSTYMRARKLDIVTPSVRLHIDALDNLDPEVFFRLRVARTGE